MQDQHLFEYAVIRVVPKVEREEFMNVGVIVFCKKQRYLRTKLQLHDVRLKAFAPNLDTEEVTSYLLALQRICLGEPNSGTIGKLDPPARFRWLTATRSTVVQTSRIHPGFSSDLDATLEKLFQQLVL